MKIGSQYKFKAWLLSTLCGCFSVAYAATNDTLVLPVRLSANLDYCYSTRCFIGKQTDTIDLVNKDEGFCYLAGFNNNGRDTTKSKVYLEGDKWKIHFELGQGAQTRATCILWANKKTTACVTRCTSD